MIEIKEIKSRVISISEFKDLCQKRVKNITTNPQFNFGDIVLVNDSSIKSEEQKIHTFPLFITGIDWSASTRIWVYSGQAYIQDHFTPMSSVAENEILIKLEENKNESKINS